MKKFCLFICVICLFIGCKEINLHTPYGQNDGVAPGKVQFLSYVPTAGGAEITFKSPEDEDLMSIVAKYTLASGVEMESKVSSYSNKLIVEGFGDTEPKQIILYAVDRMENAGDTTRCEIIPLTPSYLEAYNTVKMTDTFGGVAVTMQNPHESDLSIDVVTTDSLDQLAVIQTQYTSVKDISFAVRGYEPEERIFGIVIRDRWDNVTDTIFQSIIPWEEHELDKGKFKEIHLDNDIYMNSWGRTMSLMWNGEHSYSDDWDINHAVNFIDQGFPAWFTFDLGTVAHLSRYVFWQRLYGYEYKDANFKEWEVWGRADAPTQDGSWDGWTLLLECENYKPSGLPVGQTSTEDIEYATNGQEFLFPIDAPAVRYIRFKIISTFSGATSGYVKEVTFYGNDAD